MELEEYWDTHYVFDKYSVNRKKNLGASTLDVLIINAIVPFYFFLGKKQEKYNTYATSLLGEVRSEKNTIVEKYVKAGKKVNSAADSQALIQLYNFYCSDKKCLTCSIGKQLIKHD